MRLNNTEAVPLTNAFYTQDSADYPQLVNGKSTNSLS